MKTDKKQKNISKTKCSKTKQKAIDLLNSWIEDGDKQEQTETWEYLKRELNKNRLSDRKFF